MVEEVAEKKNSVNFFLVGGTIGRLAGFSIGVGAHFHANALQDLLDSHVAIPVARGGKFAGNDFARFVDAGHDDFCDKADLGRFGWVFFSAVHAEFVKTIRIMGLDLKQQENQHEHQHQVSQYQ